MSNNIAVVASNAWYIYNFRRDLLLELSKRYKKVFVVVGYDGYENNVSEISNNIEVVDSSLDRKSTGIVKNLRLLYFYYSFLKNNNVSFALNFTIKPNVFSGAACRNRTDHLMITNQLLYQMS